MKKYISTLAVLFTVILSACSNEDIPVQETTVINVNPSTVMENFTYQCNPGDLDGVNSEYGQELRIRLLIYDEDGIYVDEYAQNVRNYLTTATFEVTLPGNQSYTAIAITDVISNKDGAMPEYWEIENIENISTLQIRYLGSVENYGDQEILGVKSTTIYSGENTTINVEAAGALVCTKFLNLHAYANTGSIIIFSDRANGFFDFSNGGTIKSNPLIDTNATFLSVEDIPNYRYQGSYSYKFMMPQTNMKIYYGIFDTNGDVAGVSASENVDLEMGKEYICYIKLDPKNNGSGEYEYGIRPVGSGIEDFVTYKKETTIEESISCSEKNTYFVKELIEIQGEK